MNIEIYNAMGQRMFVTTYKVKYHNKFMIICT